MKFTLAIDPGGTTGLALRINNDLLTTTVNTDVDLWKYFENGETWPTTVVMEEWQYFNGIVTPAGFHTANLVASVRGICHIRCIPCLLRTPQSRYFRQRAAEEWLKKNKGMKGHEWVVHEADALAHLLTWESGGGTRRR